MLAISRPISTCREQIKLTAGIRYTDEKKTLRFNDNRASCNDGTLARRAALTMRT